MGITTRTRVAAAGTALLIGMAVSPATAADQGRSQLEQLPYAISSTAESNAAHYREALQGSIGGTTSDGNCSVEQPHMVPQPELDIRTVIKREDVAVGSSECADGGYGHFYHEAEMYFEYLNNFDVWTRTTEYTARASNTSTRGVSVLPITADYLYPTDHPGTFHAIHRACYRLIRPISRWPLCSAPSLFGGTATDLD
jgi:hypothetical protein